jgi:hypothetical protein
MEEAMKCTWCGNTKEEMFLLVGIKPYGVFCSEECSLNWVLDLHEKVKHMAEVLSSKPQKEIKTSDS